MGLEKRYHVILKSSRTGNPVPVNSGHTFLQVHYYTVIPPTIICDNCRMALETMCSNE